MSFLSLNFAIYFIILVCVLFVFNSFIRNKIYSISIQKIIFFSASIFFYLLTDLKFITILIYVILLSYFAGKYLSINKNKIIMFLLILADLIPLLFFKYFSHNLFFPIGLSFYTFQSIAYIDYCFKSNKNNSFLDTACFISFFPVITSGPIQRPERLIPQFQNIKKFNYDNATDGIKLFCWGLFKKTCIADRISIYVNSIYSTIDQQYGFALLMAIFLYSFQIYCDFSAYSDMACAIAKYLGFDVGKNFDHPYLSQSVGEFWRRWHISLSSWLRDYIYIPLGGSRVIIPRIYINIMLTFFISGIWHGSTLNFIIWGLLHGFLLCIERIINPLLEKKKIPVFLKIFITFWIVSLTWIFFRVENLHDVLKIFNKIINIPLIINDFFVLKGKYGIIESIRIIFGLNNNLFGFNDLLKVFITTSIFIITSIITFNKDGLKLLNSQKTIIRYLIYFAFVFIILYFMPNAYSENFIYSNF